MSAVTLGSLAVGSAVKLNVNGTAKEFIVVHQGLPPTYYDSTCNGTWLLMKQAYESMVWNDNYEQDNDYAESSIHDYLNSTFLGLLDSNIQSAIKQVKIPYFNGNGLEGGEQWTTNGLSTKIFLLSKKEVDTTSSDYNVSDGSILSYFSGAANSKKIAYDSSGTARSWWLRSPLRPPDGYEEYDEDYYLGLECAWWIETDGTPSYGGGSPVYAMFNYVRPAFVLPSTIWADESNNVITTPPYNTYAGVSGVVRSVTDYAGVSGAVRSVTTYKGVGGAVRS